MIINFPIKCNVCETIALIKVGIGYQLTHNQKWECKECSTKNEFIFDVIVMYYQGMKISALLIVNSLIKILRK